MVAARDVPDTEMIPSLLALSDVMGTGWFPADAANTKPGATVVVVGDLTVGLLVVFLAKQMPTAHRSIRPPTLLSAAASFKRRLIACGPPSSAVS